MAEGDLYLEVEVNEAPELHVPTGFLVGVFGSEVTISASDSTASTDFESTNATIEDRLTTTATVI